MTMSTRITKVSRRLPVLDTARIVRLTNRATTLGVGSSGPIRLSTASPTKATAYPP